VMFLSVAASAQTQAPAQEGTLTFAPPAPAAEPASPQGVAGIGGWQLEIGYEYGRSRATTTTIVTTHGLNLSVVKFFGGHFGLEGSASAGFGNTNNGTFPKNLVANTVFLGGGAKVAFGRGSHVEPWAHALVGLENFRFTQTATMGSMQSVGYVLGGGIDWHLGPIAALRTEGDFLGTNFTNLKTTNFKLVGGLVVNF